MARLAMGAYLRLRPLIIFTLLKNLLDLARNTDYHLSTSYGILTIFSMRKGGVSAKIHRPHKIKKPLSREVHIIR